MLLQESRDSVAKIRSSLLNLVDLAGSERQRDTHTEGLRLKVIIMLMYVHVHTVNLEIFDGNKFPWLAKSMKIKHTKNNTQ